MKRIFKSLLCVLVFTLVIGALLVKFDSRIYYVNDSIESSYYYKVSILDENGDQYIIESNDNLSGQWIESKEIGYRFNWMNNKDYKQVYIYDYKIMK